MNRQLSRDEAIERLERVENTLEATRQALQLLNDDVDELREENADLRERVAHLEGEVTPDPSSKPYNEKSRDEKVREVRIALGRKARQQGGKASMTYTDVLSLFGNHPSRGHSYKLMELAANLDGFEYDQHGGDQIRLLVNLDTVNDDAVLHAVNTPDESEVN